MTSERDKLRYKSYLNKGNQKSKVKVLFDHISSSGGAIGFPKLSKESISGLEGTDLGHESRFSGQICAHFGPEGKPFERIGM